MTKNNSGRIYQIRWLNPYTEPPDGAPRVLCEIYLPEHPGGKAPKEIDDFPISIGGGYSLCSLALAVPVKQLPPATLAVIRKKRIARSIAAKVPMFADHFIAEAIAKKPEYYDGITDAGLQASKDALNDRETAHLLELTSRPNELIVYGHEPQACKDKAAKLKAEMEEVKRKAEERKNNALVK